MKKVIILMVLVLAGINSDAQKIKSQRMNPMKEEHKASFASHLRQMYTVYITRNVQESYRFYKQWFGMEVVFESSWFILLATPTQPSTLLAFMHEQHPSSPPTPKALKGDGAFLTFQVADVLQVYTVMKKAGLPISYGLKEEPWGQRRFGVVDPNGMWIDVVEQIEPSPGFWEKYIAR